MFCNRLVAFVLSVLTQLAKGQPLFPEVPAVSDAEGEDAKPKDMPWRKIIMCSAANIVSTSCHYQALKYISFTTHIVTKSAKMVPVMLVERTLFGRSHFFSEYLIAVLVTAGVVLFKLNAPRGGGGGGGGAAS